MAVFSRKLLQDRDLSYQSLQYSEKNGLLAGWGEQVSALSFYEDLFGDLSLLMPVVVLDEDATKHIVKMTIAEALDQAASRNDLLLGGSTFFKQYISKATTKDVHALIVDMDNVYSGTLLQIIQAGWGDVNGRSWPLPTYIVNSGTGLHLYFVFDQPLPHYKRFEQAIDTLYRTLAAQQTQGWPYLVRQVQWYGQDFRLAGGCGKNGWENTVFRVGEKWNPNNLAHELGLNITFDLDARPVKCPQTRKFARKGQGWHSHRGFYYHALAGVKNRTVEGNRYTSMCALAVIAWKCDISYEQLKDDLYALLPLFNERGNTEVKPREVVSALKMYNDKAMLTPRVRLEDWQGWKYEGQKRNYRKQDIHLFLARNQKVALKMLGEMKQEGRPSACDQVISWRRDHPEGRKVDCINDTGLAKSTVYKWWNSEPDSDIE